MVQEKEILHSIIDQIDKLTPLVEQEITIKKARKIIDSYANFEKCQEYFDKIICPLIKVKDGTGTSS